MAADFSVTSARARGRESMGAHPWRSIEELLDTLWPPRCHLCGADGGGSWACASHRLPGAPPPPRCGRCAGSLPDVLPHGELCAACRRQAPGFDVALALADYRAQPAAAEWLLALKHGGRRDLARPLGHALGGLLAGARPPGRRPERAGSPEPDDAQPALLVPIPLHPLRRLERGYDQALLLARAAAERAQLELAPLLARRRSTRPQGEPGASSRSANVADAFAVRRRSAQRLVGRRIWLVDDVATSGATASEAARVLRRAGARAVGLLVVARGGGDPWRGPQQA